MLWKIAVIADIHFGALSSMTTQLYNNLHTYFLDKLKEMQPNLIVIAGDYWHLKLPLTSIESQLGISFMKELDAAFPTTYKLLIKGTDSHDLNQLDVFKSMENKYFRIYNHFQVEYLDDLKLLIIPEEYFPSKDVYKEVLNPPEKYDMVFFHGLFSFAGNYALKSGNKFNKICFNSSEFENIVYGKVIGGHVHDPLCSDVKSLKDSPLVMYTGSFERWKHGEELLKGWRYIEYDSDSKKTIKNIFEINHGASKYVTLSYKVFDCKNIDNLIKEIDKESKDKTSLRIKINREDNITDSEINNLIAASMKFNNVVLYKEIKISSKNNADEMAEEENARKERISEYRDMTFNQITKKFAKDELGSVIIDEDISNALTN